MILAEEKLPRLDAERHAQFRWLNPAIPSRTLATLRDTLPPKLLSGELSVASANKLQHLA